MKLKQLLLIFIPAFCLMALILFIRIVQYEPLYSTPKNQSENTSEEKSSIPIFPEDPILGDKKAASNVLIFADFGCEHCKSDYDIIKELITQYPKKVKVIWKGLPVTKFPYNSEPAHRVAFCAQKQGKFEPLADVFFENQTSLSPENIQTFATQVGLNQTELATCVEAADTTSYIQKNKDLARLLNIQAVPAVFLNNNQIPTPQSLEEWKTVLSL